MKTRKKFKLQDCLERLEQRLFLNRVDPLTLQNLWSPVLFEGLQAWAAKNMRNPLIIDAAYREMIRFGWPSRPKITRHTKRDRTGNRLVTEIVENFKERMNDKPTLGPPGPPYLPQLELLVMEHLAQALRTPQKETPKPTQPARMFDDSTTVDPLLDENIKESKSKVRTFEDDNAYDPFLTKRPLVWKDIDDDEAIN